MHSWSRAAALTCWANSWLAGQCSLDETDERIRGDDTAHHVVYGSRTGADESTGPQMPEHPDIGGSHQPIAGDGPSDDSGAEPLLLALGRIRRQGATRFTLALPMPGDPVGIAGPREFTEAAIEACEAVVCAGAGLGLVPELIGSGVQWAVYPATPVPPPSLSDADSELAEALLATTQTLVDLDIAQWRPEAADAMAALRDAGPGDRDGLPPGYSARAARVATRALRCRTLCDLALADDGGAITAHRADARRDALRPLERAARRALVAACSDLG